MNRQIVFSCEHGGNIVPQDYEDLFLGQENLLSSHRGYDPGALELAKELAAQHSGPLFFSTTTRLLIDLNRSLSNKTLFSQIVTKGLSQKQKEAVIHNYYFPYRSKIENHIKELITSKNPVLHLSIHTFTPILDGEERTADIGLLYDPKRKQEVEFCSMWMENLQGKGKDQYIVKKNYPYQGNADGLTTHLRSLYAEEMYLGIEVEVNQKYPQTLRNEWPHLKDVILQSLMKTVKDLKWT